MLGTDGGGAACRARLVDDGGALLGEAVSGSASLTLGVEVPPRSAPMYADLARGDALS